jgi:hypothetical protein
MSEKQSNLRRNRGLANQDQRNWNQRRFEQEVAEEINAGRQRDRQEQERRNPQPGHAGAQATFAGPKSNRETGNFDHHTPKRTESDRDPKRC